MKKGLAQYLIVGVVILLAALAVTQGDVALAGLGWAKASTDAATPAATLADAPSGPVPTPMH